MKSGSVKKTILIIDDDRIFANAARDHLSSENVEVLIANTAAEGLELCAQGKVDVVLRRPNANDVVVTQYGPGQYFGEIEMLRGGARIATIRAAEGEPVEVVALDRETFTNLMNESDATHDALTRQAETRLAVNRVPEA